MGIQTLRFCRVLAARVVFLTVLACYCSAVLPSQQKAAPRQFLIASDIHFNPMADASLVNALVKADVASWESILRRTESTAFSQYGQDTNWWLLQSALDAMKKTTPAPPIIIFNGDLLAHHFPRTFEAATHNKDPQVYREFVRKTVEFLALQLRKRFPQAAILVTPGNNDDDCGDYSIAPGGAFLDDTAGIVRRLTRGGADVEQSWRTLGSFEIGNPSVHNAKIISVNTAFLSAKYTPQEFSKGCATVSNTAPEDVMAWLTGRLEKAAAAHEKVWLMFHVPPGIDGFSTMLKFVSLRQEGKPPEVACKRAIVPMLDPRWTAEFDKILKQYAGTVTATLAAHTHVDDFRVIGVTDAQPRYVLVNPPISPVYNQNPSFRVATIGTNGNLRDDSVYYLTNLEYASKTTPGDWQREYTFSQEWRVQGVSAENFAAIYNRILNDDDARAQYLKLYSVSSAAAHLPQGLTSALYCGIGGLDAESYGKCFCAGVVH